MRLDDTAALRRIILRIMLGALSVSAALAVLGVMVGAARDQSPRMIGTGIAAAVASALLLASCKFLDSEKFRRTGLFVMALILLQFILVLAALWGDLWMSRSNRVVDTLALIAAMYPIAAVPAAIFFHVRQLPGGRFAGIFGMVSCCLAFAFFAIAASDDRWFVNYTMSAIYWETGWACWFFAIVAAACSAGAGIDRKHWRWIGLAAAALAFGLGLYNVWGSRENAIELFTIATTLAILIGHANILWLCKLTSAQRWLRWATAIFAWIAGVIFDYAAITNFTERTNEDFLGRIGIAATICAACGTVAVAILTAFNRRIAPKPTAGIDTAQIDIICPICHKKQTIPIKDGTGESNCNNCGLILSIRLRAPRCPSCDYTLLMLKTNRCPECGTPIANSSPTISLLPPAAGA
jgi:ssDNA-binding Zn-finger/Zn-ribbon topoisomerase 1